MENETEEKIVKEFLSKKGLCAEYFNKEEKKKSKTPDFRVFKGNEFAFFCEVKTVSRDDVEGLRNDPIFNRLTDDIHNAVKQFDAVNGDVEYFNVLAFVNHDRMCDFGDLREVLTGDFYAEGGQRFPISRKFSEGRIREDKKRIHLYLWLDRAKREELEGRSNRHHLIFNVSKEDEQKQSRLYEYFDKKPELEYSEAPMVRRAIKFFALLRMTSKKRHD